MEAITVNLRKHIDRYQLNIDGVKAWTPYWRDELPTLQSPHPLTGPYKGKGSPNQIKDYLLAHLNDEVERSEDGIRRFMKQLHLGVDCSGFLYHVLDGLVQDRLGRRLADHLYKPRQALIADFHNPVYTHPPNITLELLQGQPEQVSLSTIQEFWGNDPVRLAGVHILCSPAATSSVPSVAALHPADLIELTGSDGIPHCLLVVQNDGQTITYAHSGRNQPSEIGGVEYKTIEITAPQDPIFMQQWSDRQVSPQSFGGQPLRRLNVLSKLIESEKDHG